MVTFESNGLLTFRVYLPHAESVELLADFNNWKQGSLPLERVTEDGEACTDGAWRGWWQLTTETPDGDHSFSYLVDGHWWLPDYSAHGVRRNEYGNWTSLLFVPLPRRLGERLEKRRSFSTSVPSGSGRIA